MSRSTAGVCGGNFGAHIRHYGAMSLRPLVPCWVAVVIVAACSANSEDPESRRDEEDAATSVADAAAPEPLADARATPEDLQGESDPIVFYADAAPADAGVAPDTKPAEITCESAACEGAVVGRWRLADGCTIETVKETQTYPCPDSTARLEARVVDVLEDFKADGSYRATIVFGERRFEVTTTSACLDRFDPKREIFPTCARYGELLAEQNDGMAPSCTGDRATSCRCTSSQRNAPQQREGSWTQTGSRLRVTYLHRDAGVTYESDVCAQDGRLTAQRWAGSPWTVLLKQAP